jgi:hypothetical protein
MSDVKIEQQFKKNLNEIEQVLGKNTDLLKKVKRVDSTTTTNIVEDILKERREKLYNEVKTEFTGLLESYITFTEESAKAKQEFEKLIDNKMKEFNEKAVKVLNKITLNNQREQTISEAVSSVITIDEEPKTE